MNAAWAIAVSAMLALPSAATPASPGGRVLDDFERIDAWQAVASDAVSASLRQVDGVRGRALCLDYDFNGVSGYAVARRTLPMAFPPNYEFALQLRGAGPVNNLEFKLADAGGDNVWWVDKPNFPLPAQWTPLRLRKRNIAFAWGPTADKVLRQSRTFELTISAGKGGGRGEACIDELTFRELPVDDSPPPAPVATASAQLPDGRAAHAVDGNAATAWQARIGDRPTLTLDLGREREFGGLELRWRPGEQASRYRIALSVDGQAWHEVRRVVAGNGGMDPIALPDSDARFVRLQCEAGPSPTVGLEEVAIEPLEFAATPNAFIAAVAREAPRGRYPRGFVGEQAYWTIVGIDGGSDQGLLGEDGAIEVAKGGFSIEPFVRVEGELAGWANVQSSQSLQDGYLPVPRVHWTHPAFALDVDAFARGTRDASQLVARYRLANTTARPRDYTLALALRPMQVNPPSQFLNTPGGFSPIGSMAFDGEVVRIDGVARLRSLTPMDAAFATSFDAGDAVEQLANGTTPSSQRVDDAQGMASGAMLYRIHLAPGESREVAWMAPLSGALPQDLPGTPAQAQSAVASGWRRTLGRVAIRVPAEGQHLVDSLRSALAYMLVSRDGPRLQPGTRSYARAWIRDGAMISEALLRMGRGDVATGFLDWYARYQFPSGKVPCCVDDRGSDPVPENDSQGELIHAVAEAYRYTGDRRRLEAMWPHVRGAVAYMDVLRASERTEANRARNPAFYGLMPASISHEGYSAKAMHSYWDDFWALRGYADAVQIADWLGKAAEAKRIDASRDAFRVDLHASIVAAMAQKRIDFVPGSAELGDFDATSTTIALAPGTELEVPLQAPLRNTFERYWREFVQRRDGARPWKDYTPYELRTLGSFVRLGWRDRIGAALDFFFQGQQPPAWNQWAEVVARDPRKPFFVGDLPHAWVESDYVRSVLDLFAHEREHDDALVIAAGIPARWFDGKGIAIEGLRTPYGPLNYSARRSAHTFSVVLSAGLRPPPGGIVLPWPYAGAPGAARIDGRPAQWNNGELRIPSVPARVEITMP